MAWRDWVQPALQGLLWVVLMSLAMGWLARSRLKPRPASEARRLVPAVGGLVAGLVGFVFFAGIAILSNVYRNKTTTVWTTTFFVGFALVCLVIVVDYFLGRHVVSDSGIEFARLTWTRGRLYWMELKSVRYAPGMKWFRLESRTGEVARISAMCMGLPEFARLVLAHAPADAIEPETRAILEATAAGHPPAVW